MTGRLAARVLWLPLLLAAAPLVAQSTDFSRLSASLSENEGFFNSDNLVSNETSYLHVLGAFRRLGVRGGAYIGVGPEQGFSYIAEIQPEIAFIIDIRRDNLLLHLLLKAMFIQARNRMEFLCLLYGRPAPDELPLWTELELEALLDYLDRTPGDPAVHDRNHRELMKAVDGYGFRLTAEDRTTLRQFHDEFAQLGLDIRYSSRGRPARLSFPTARRLYLETDLDGTEASYLGSEERWRVVRALQQRHRVVPVVGDLAGPRALRGIGDRLREAGQEVSVLYVSNVESYLFRYGTFDAFADNVRSLPNGASSVIVRSWFGRGGFLPNSEPGHFSTQLLQTFAQFRDLTLRPDPVDYMTVVNDGLDLRAPALPSPRR